MIGVITKGKSDLLSVLEKNYVDYEIVSLDFKKLKDYDALMIIGGTENKPLSLLPHQYLEIEKYIQSGKKVFAEYIVSLGAYLSDGYIDSRYERIVYHGANLEGLNKNEIIDPQQSYRMVPFHDILKNKNVLASFTKEHVHSKAKNKNKNLDVSDYALFFLEDNVLISSFQMANYRQGRFAPFARTDALIKLVLEWISDKEINTSLMAKPYTLNKEIEKEKVLRRTLDWFDQNKILIEEGKHGVYEGFGSEIYTDGSQRFADTVRGDCTGEAAWLYYLSGIYLQDKRYSKISSHLFASTISDFVIMEGKHKGFVRWSNAALESNYGDDVARMLMPLILKNLLGDGEDEDVKVIEAVCDFHIKTSGKDGIRRSRFELAELSDEEIRTANQEVLSCPSAHYNAYLHATYLLAYKLTNKEDYLKFGLMGIDSLMDLYPNTQREQSQTQEEARLILPLAIALWASKDQKYKKHLDEVYFDLLKRKHESGAFLEWDEGYKAVMRHTKGDGECSLLSENGDSVADLLYTNNWLGMGFIFAYIASDDEKYLKEAGSIINFFVESQMISKDKQINGVWARAFDPDLKEYFGSPADKGWGPYCIESGWTVSQIASGIVLYELMDDIKERLSEVER